MCARRSVWSDDEVQQLVRRFVPVADEVGRLQREKDAESALFQGFCEQGHYGGRTRPTSTRQGIYAVAPSGRFLASINSNDAGKVAAMLRLALDRFAELPAEQRQLSADAKARLAAVRRFEDRRPDDGLVLAEYVRDLDREVVAADWRTRAWNEDQAWFTAAEARTFVPAEPQPGATVLVPERLARRLVRLHLLDIVRGQTPSLPRDAVQAAELRSEVVAATGSLVQLRLSGRSLAVQHGRWIVADRGEPVDAERGVRTAIDGRATWDTATQRFTRFELLCVGDRWGATQYNQRTDDRGPTAIGFAFVLAPADHPRVAPAFWWEYDLQ